MLLHVITGTIVIIIIVIIISFFLQSMIGIPHN